MVFVNIAKPGAGMNIDPAHLDTRGLATFQKIASSESTTDFLLNIIPTSVADAFARGDMLQVLMFSVLFGVGLSFIGNTGKPVLDLFDKISHVLFAIVGVIMKVAPLGAFGAMAFAVGKFGVATLIPLANLMVVIYASCLFFIVFVLGGIAWLSGFSLWKFLLYVKEELFLVLATTSSETALPTLIKKLEHAGCSEQVVGLVVPTGYSFNLDGTCICQVICAMFIAQAMGIELSVGNQITLVAVSMLTSKGSAGVAGASFIALLATLTAFRQIPIEGAAIILGVDRFISEIRTATNMIGNGVATLVVARWEGERDDVRMHAALNQTSPVPEENEKVAAEGIAPVLPQASYAKTAATRGFAS
jgi:aerobic C4-dicarboxylate transport protein